MEGVGGFRVPLGAGYRHRATGARLALPVVLVVGMRLGCLNHALLTVEAIAARGLKLAGWVANHIDPQMAAADENVRALEALIAAPLLARVAFSAVPAARGYRSPAGHRQTDATRLTQLVAHAEVLARCFGCLARRGCDTFRTLDAGVRAGKSDRKYGTTAILHPRPVVQWTPGAITRSIPSAGFSHWAASSSFRPAFERRPAALAGARDRERAARQHAENGAVRADITTHQAHR